MWLHHSNRMEALAAGLADLMRKDPLPPAESERVVVPHPGIGRWLSLELARALGVAAHLRFEQPAEFAWSIMRGAAPDLPREQPYAPAQLRWRIHDLLPRRPEEPAGDALHGYLRDGDPRTRFELADRLARFFDRCLLYRPDWIREWDRGALPHWQAGLWRRLREADGPAGSAHWVASVDAFRAALAEGREARGGPPADTRRAGTPEEAPEGPRAGAPSSEAPAARGSPAAARWPPPAWPRRASFFAVPALSPSYLEMLCEAARGIDLHVFLLNPCREYWGDVHSRREIARRARGADPRDRYLSEGNELLAAWGRAGRDTFDTFLEVAGVESEERFVAPAGARRLAALQRDVLDLRLAGEAADAARRGTASSGGPVEAPPAEATVAGGSGGAGPADLPPAAGGRCPDPPPADDSLQIHVCHSPLREAEVLHDRLLALFDAHRDLEPAHVLVLTPELGVYGPAIEAVFGAAGRIPCHVARAPAARSRALRAFLEVLALPGSRYGAGSVLAPLAAPALRARFGIGEAELPALRDLVREAGVRFCVDEAHREGEGLPATSEHTWRQGLRRLLLGYAMGDADTLVAGVAPGPAIGSTGFEALRAEVGAETLGRFLTYCEAAFALRERLAGERRPARWAATLRQVADTFFADAPPPRGRGVAVGADERGALRELIRDFTRESAGGASPVRFEVVRDVLREHAGESARASPRLADGVSVASLAPGRVFPAEVVCVVGMNDGVFPRSPSFPSFDLVAAGAARRGDRDVRHEDRFAFLEALLAARRVFLVSYTGRGLRDDAALPPSVLVDELRDYLGRRFPGMEFETRHPLQPFSPRYFAAPEGATEPRGDAAPDAPGVASGAGGAGGDAAPGDAPDGAEEQKGARAARGRTGSAGVTPSRGPGPPREGEGLFSYSRGMCEAARALRAGPEAAGAPERFAASLPEPEESRRRVTLTELVAFFANPARAFLRDRLGVRLEVDDLAVDAEEPFEIEGLERYRMRSEIWDQVRAGTAAERGAALLRGRGRLPHANLGRVVHERAREEAEQLADRLAPYRAALEAPPREIDFALGGFRLVGTIDRFDPDASASGEDGPGAGATREEEPDGAGSGEGGPGLMLWWRIGSLRARDQVEIGLRQLAWAAAGHAPARALGISMEHGSWKRTCFPPPERARERLEAWLRAWWRGLSAPLPFFPETSFAYARSIARSAEEGGGAREAALAKARECWFGDRYHRGERLDPYLALAHDDGDPLSGDFEELALALVAPLHGAGR